MYYILPLEKIKCESLDQETLKAIQDNGLEFRMQH